MARLENRNLLDEKSLFRFVLQAQAGQPPRIRVAIAEDNPEMLVVLRLLLKLSTDFELVFDVSNGQEAVEGVRSLVPDVLVMDIRMPILDGLLATRQIVELALGTQVILISSYTGSYIVRKTAEAGARGYVPKDDLVRDLPRAIRAVHRGDTFFLG